MPTSDSAQEFRRTTRRPQWGRPIDAQNDFRCVCPNCGHTLREKECKSRCPECHFFSDCSDPW